MTAPVEAYQHPRFARAYLRGVELADRRGAADHRRRLLEGLSGRVIEVGAGSGANFPHYPAAVTEVVAVEPDDTLRAHAEREARRAPVPVSVVAGHAEELPGGDAAFDAAVASLVLCSVPSPPAALAELARVLRPGGELRFYEHVRSARALLGLLEDAVVPLWARAAGGCHPNRDTLAGIQGAGFEVDAVERFAFAPQPLIPPLTHVLGRAHRS